MQSRKSSLWPSSLPGRRILSRKYYPTSRLAIALRIPAFIHVAKFLLQRPNVLTIIEVMDGKETGSRTLSISHFDDGTLFSSRKKEGLLLVCATS